MLLVAVDEVDVNVTKVTVAAVMVAPGGITLRSNCAQPRLLGAVPPLLILVMLPSTFVPVELTAPDLNVPVEHVMFTVV